MKPIYSRETTLFNYVQTARLPILIFNPFSEPINPVQTKNERERMIEMSQPWEPPQLANFGHAIPHINFSLQLQSNDFQPYRATYQEVRLFLV